jgi:hypothetical protein
VNYTLLLLVDYCIACASRLGIYEFQVISTVYSILYGQVVSFNRFILTFVSVSPDTKSSLEVFLSFLGHIYWFQDYLEYFLHFLLSFSFGVFVRLPFNLLHFLPIHAAILSLTLTIASVSLFGCCDDRPFLKFVVVFPARCRDNRSFLKVYLVSAVRCCENRSFLKVYFSFSGQDL